MSFMSMLSSKPMAVFLIICFVLAIIVILAILCNIETYTTNCVQQQKIDLAKQKIIEEEKPEPKESINDRLDATTKVMELISTMVESEVGAVTFKNMVLGQPYEIARLDADVKVISENVFHGIRPEMLNDPENIMTAEYIMGLITKFSSVMLINKVTEINKTLRERKMLD